jgi:Fur family transcriptional regulator, ferric uptake regulator
MTERRDESAALAERLLGIGLRPTPQRMLVLETLAAEPHDATAQEIHARLRERGERVGLATVYRALSVLSEGDVVDELSHRVGETCYRLCSPGHHHHLVCSSCHRVEELEGCEIDAWVEGGRVRDEPPASRAHDFKAASHTVEVVGVCADCRAA